MKAQTISKGVISLILSNEFTEQQLGLAGAQKGLGLHCRKGPTIMRKTNRVTESASHASLFVVQYECFKIIPLSFDNVHWLKWDGLSVWTKAMLYLSAHLWNISLSPAIWWRHPSIQDPLTLKGVTFQGFSFTPWPCGNHRVGSSFNPSVLLLLLSIISFERSQNKLIT